MFAYVVSSPPRMNLAPFGRTVSASKTVIDRQMLLLITSAEVLKKSRTRPPFHGMNTAR